MSVGNGKNVSTPYNLNKNSINKFNYLLSRQRSLPAIQVNQQQHIHLFPVYQQVSIFVWKCGPLCSNTILKLINAKMLLIC